GEGIHKMETLYTGV
ncbi:unnamed protein product, partial [Allacma fusca]